ncbi:hypothetical protein JOC34_000019 [Virgibacillus halotolerans]|uniref:hypothetical protein n=1 Tax=Virgibacillus halotolerans TaxID=1071053 RepID=UPI00195FA468|nr:hypothetical protein [Virgibacillus halotolerans]MBM7597662.1 hypothetical protein [Virgibacillus halotolerans]
MNNNQDKCIQYGKTKNILDVQVKVSCEMQQAIIETKTMYHLIQCLGTVKYDEKAK